MPINFLYGSITWILLQIQPVVVNKLLPVKKLPRDESKNYIILHYDEGTSYNGTRTTLIKTGSSYHYYIQRNGNIIQLVDTKYQAGHAGISYYNGLFKMNKYSIGICLQNKPPQQYTEVQYQRLVWLIKQLQVKYPDSTSKIILGHSDIAIPRGRKKDPGNHFNWKFFREQEK
jgi:N-acetyl-anhydromuramyl-L-alanine amidase AmpD